MTSKRSTADSKSPKQPKQSAKKATATRPDEMSDEVVEFITAVDEYKREHGRPFPGLSELFEIIKALGYAKV
jgi:hypothetical protein